jgi:hypothetical protein
MSGEGQNLPAITTAVASARLLRLRAALGMPRPSACRSSPVKYALRGFKPMLVALLRFSIAGIVLWVAWRPSLGANT